MLLIKEKKHELIIGSLLIILCAIYYECCFESQLHCLYQLRENINQLNQKLRTQSIQPSIHKTIQHSDIAGEILQIANQSQMEITAIQIKTPHDVNVIAQGNFLAFLQWIKRLNKHALMMNTFNVHTISNTQIVVDTALKIGPQELPFTLNSTINENPFRPHLAFVLNANINAEASLNTYSIQELHFAGYLIENNKIEAIVKLITGKSWLVKEGMKIGRENASILQIHSDGIVISLPSRDRLGANKIIIRS